jgi:hypothetical protein
LHFVERANAIAAVAEPATLVLLMPVVTDCRLRRGRVAHRISSTRKRATVPFIDQIVGHLRRQRHSPILPACGPRRLALTLVTDIAVMVGPNMYGPNSPTPNYFSARSQQGVYPK